MTNQKKRRKRQRLLKSPKSTIGPSTTMNLRTKSRISLNVCHSTLLISGAVNLVEQRSQVGSGHPMRMNQAKLQRSPKLATSKVRLISLTWRNINNSLRSKKKLSAGSLICSRKSTRRSSDSLSISTWKCLRVSRPRMFSPTFLKTLIATGKAWWNS